MKPSEALKLHRDEVLEIIARYPVRNPQIFLYRKITELDE